MLRAWVPLARQTTTLRWANRCHRVVSTSRVPSSSFQPSVFSTLVGARRSFTAPPKVPPPAKLKGTAYFIPDHNGKFLEEDLEAPRFPLHAFSSFMWVLDLTKKGPKNVPLEEINPEDLAFAIAVHGYADLLFTPDKLSDKQNAVWQKNHHTYKARMEALYEIQEKYFAGAANKDPTSEPGLLRKKENLIAFRVQPLPDETKAVDEPLPFTLPKPTLPPAPKPTPPAKSGSSNSPVPDEKPIEEILDASYFSESTAPILITFDTETNDHPKANPFMIELGWCLFDAQGKILKGYPTSHLIKPEKFGPKRVHPEAQKIHGISFQDIQQNGAPLVDVLKLFSNDLKQVMAQEGGKVASYNLPFDSAMLLNSLEGTKAFPNSAGRIKTLFKERGLCAMEEVTKAQRGTPSKLSGAFQKYASLSDEKKQELLHQNHHAATDSVITGLVLFGLSNQ